MSGELASVREVWAERSTARRGGWDLAYLVYVVLISAVVVVAPALRTAGEVLARPDVLPLLLAPGAPATGVLLAGAAAAGMVLLGGARGPALLSPFLTATLADGPLRRRTVLGRPYARALLVPLLGTLVLAGLVGTTLVEAGTVPLAGLAPWLVGAAGTGLLLGACWLAGELAAPAVRRLLALGVLVATGLLALAGPAGPAALHPLVGGAATAWAGGLLIAGVLAAATGWPLLDRLRGTVLHRQAERWDAASTSAGTGDLAGAAAGYRAAPTLGRRLPAVGGGGLALLYLRRDVVAWLRSPERTGLGALAVVGGAALLTAGGLLVTGLPAVLAIGAGSLVMWLGGGTLVDGLRHAVHTLGAPTLFGQGAEAQALLHALAPLLALLVLGGLGALPVAAAAGVPGVGALLLALAPALLLAPVIVAGRLRDAAKGPLPLALTTPMPTPQGDASLLPLLAWESDALLLQLIATAVIVLAAAAGGAALLAAPLLVLAALLVMARIRLGALRA